MGSMCKDQTDKNHSLQPCSNEWADSNNKFGHTESNADEKNARTILINRHDITLNSQWNQNKVFFKTKKAFRTHMKGKRRL